MKKFKSKVLNLYKIGFDSQLQRPLENVYRTYETSWEIELLESEQSRQVYGELIEIDKNRGQQDLVVFATKESIPNTSGKSDFAGEESDDDDETPQHSQAIISTIVESSEWWTKFSVESNRPKLLKEITIESLGQNFKSGDIDDRIFCEDEQKLGKLIDVEIPVLDLLDVNNDSFWKTLVISKVTNTGNYEKLARDPSTNWKQVGIQMKFEEIIENMPEAEFRYASTSESFLKTVDRLSDFIEILNIKKLQPRLGPIVHPVNKNVNMVNIPDDECYHGSLLCLGRLKNLKSLSLNFKPNEMHINYQQRFYQTSNEDMKHLGNGLKELCNLEHFRMCETNLSDHSKLCQIMKPFIKSRVINILDFSFCRINSRESGKLFKNFLEAATSLKELRLKGNIIDEHFCEPFSSGLKNFEGKLEFLDLSLNKILGNGLSLVIKSIREAQNVEKLDISQCDSLHNQKKNLCLNELIELIKSKLKIVKSIDFHMNRIDGESIKTLIEALNLNYEIEEFDVQLCGLSITQSVDFRVLLERNRFYRENPILRKEHFTEEDEIAVEEFLRRTKNPLLLKIVKQFARCPGVFNEAHHKYKRHDDSDAEAKFLKFAKLF